MAFTLELEEWVGSVWHRFITRRASVDFPEARIELAPRQRALALLLRAMGGVGRGVEAASERDLLLRRSLLQQIAGTCRQTPWPGATPTTCACRPASRCSPRRR